ncbi:MAG: tetratricopeptide repeat protein [Deltaproteobacteria bacterium]|nr:tetratricopeptide repeat protein [Deltaproteobacteria bacterium]
MIDIRKACTGLLVCGFLGCGATGPQQKDGKIVAADVPAVVPEAQQLFEKGLATMARGPKHYEKAIEFFQKAVDRDKNLFEAWHNLGYLASRQGRWLDSVEAYDKALSIQPASRSSLLGLTNAYVRNGDPESAQARFAAWLKADPNDDEIRLLYASALREAGGMDEALTQVLGLLAKNSNNAVAFNALGLIYRKQGKGGLAETAFRRAAELDPKAGYVWNNLGLLSIDDKNDQEAFAHFSKAIELDPNYVEAILNRAVVYLDCGAYEQALEELKKAVALRASDPDVHVALGVASRGLGKMALAVQHYEKALELQPDYPPALYDLGVLYMDHRDDKKSAREKLLLFRKVASSDDPKQEDATLRLKMLQ